MIQSKLLSSCIVFISLFNLRCMSSKHRCDIDKFEKEVKTNYLKNKKYFRQLKNLADNVNQPYSLDVSEDFNFVTLNYIAKDDGTEVEFKKISSEEIKEALKLQLRFNVDSLKKVIAIMKLIGCRKLINTSNKEFKGDYQMHTDLYYKKCNDFQLIYKVMSSDLDSTLKNDVDNAFVKFRTGDFLDKNVYWYYR